MEYKLIREKSDREGLIVSTFSAKDDVDALIKVHNHCLYPLAGEDEESVGLSKEDLIDAIYDVNGGGCDYIYLLKNETTGEVLMQAEDYREGVVERW